MKRRNILIEYKEEIEQLGIPITNDDNYLIKNYQHFPSEYDLIMLENICKLKRELNAQKELHDADSIRMLVLFIIAFVSIIFAIN